MNRCIALEIKREIAHHPPSRTMRWELHKNRDVKLIAAVACSLVILDPTRGVSNR